MASDGVRMDAYARAIARAVKPGHVVLDLGSGTGIFALLAIRAGAERVHAVDINPALWLIPELAAENGLASDRIVLHPESSLELSLPDKVDVIVSDMRGVTPLCSDHVAAIRDARARWLKPGGTLIPARDRLMVAMVESSDMWTTLSRGWESFENFGFKAEAARASILNSLYSDRPAPLLASDLLTSASPWATLDYASYDGRALDSTVELKATRSGVAHGLAVWFEATTFEDIGYTTGPGFSLAYSRYFLPLLQPTRISHDASVRVTLRADARGDRWAWDTEVLEANGTSTARFRQSTFLGSPTSPAALLRNSTQFKPALSEQGQRVKRLLDAMNGERTVAELSTTLSPNATEGSPEYDTRLEELRDVVSRYAR